MDLDDFRFKISAEKYLERYDVLTYIEDAIASLLEHKDENPKVNTSKFFSDYFTSVREGNHVIFREYSFVNATQHNRACFVKTFWKCFRHIGRKGDLLSIREYHSLICLLCPDFPFAPIQKSARIILMDDALDCLISFTDFLFAFQAQFYYEDFLSKCAEVYTTILEDPHISTDPVVVPTSEITPRDLHSTSNGDLSSDPGEGADSMLFFRALLPVCEKLDLRAPPIPVLRDILGSAKRVTFYGFLMALAKSEALNESIGKLPSRSGLLTVSESEVTSSPALAANLSPVVHLSSVSLPPNPATSRTFQKQASDCQEKPKVKGRGAPPPRKQGSLTSTTRQSVSQRQDSVSDDDDDDDSTDSGSSTN